MKTGAILAAMAMAITPALAEISADFDPAAMHHMAAKDPCTNMDKKECMRDDACQYYRGPRNTDLSRKESGGRHHSAAEGEDGCAAKHLFERVSQATASDKKSMLSKHGFHSTWDTIECSEAFYMKDCKDLNQNNENQCAWTCSNGCTDYDGERRVLDPCEEAPPIYVDLYAEANYFLGYPVSDRACASVNIVDLPGFTDAIDSMDTLFPLAYDFCTTHQSCIAEVNGGADEWGSDYPGYDHMALEDIIVQISSDAGYTLGDMQVKCLVTINGSGDGPEDVFRCDQTYTNFMHPDSPLLESIIAKMAATSGGCDFAQDARAFPDGFHFLGEGVGGQYTFSG